MSTDLVHHSDNFQLLHPEMQEQLYHMNWRELKPIQSSAIQQVIEGDGHLIISAPTAGGKTEAAFLPILSVILGDQLGGVRAVYVGPLKALINDQFRRLEDLCQRSGIPVHKWHGDVAAAAKKELRKNPTGVLLITPESIESLFINYPDRLDDMFKRLAFVVVDELHSFLGTERGAHLHSLLTRLVSRSQMRVRLVALSATFGQEEGVQAARNWLSLRDGDRVAPTILEPPGGKSLRYQVKGYLRSAKVDESATRGSQEEQESSEPEVTEDDRRLVVDLFETFRDKTALVFANNKTQLEFNADLLRRHCERMGIRNPFRVHHGSLSKGEREETEDALRSDQPTVAFCSSTLEMGIDVGNVKLVGQLGAPWSVSSLTQRLGRSGRGKDESSDLRMYIQEDEPDPNATLVDRLFPSLLQAVAMSELLIAERWSEPPHADRFHASTLLQQILSVVTEHGGMRTDGLFDILIRRGAFRNIDQQFFLQVLRNMGTAELIQQMPQGELILGLVGERLVRSKDFYTAFVTGEEYAVLHDGRSVGSVAVIPSTNIDRYLILAGRRWRVVEVNPERRLILVVPAPGGRLPPFRSSGGSDIHSRVREKMRQMLLGHQVPIYLDPSGQAMLATARQAASTARLNQRSFLADGHDTVWFTWTGTRIQRTLMAFARENAGLKVHDEEIALLFENASETDVRHMLKTFLEQPPSPEALAARIVNKAQEKYEHFLSNELQAIVFGRNSLDVQGAHSLLVAQLGIVT